MRKADAATPGEWARGQLMVVGLSHHTTSLQKRAQLRPSPSVRAKGRCTKGQVRSALRLEESITNGEEIVELFIHVEAYAGAARAFDSYEVARDVFTKKAE